MGLKFDPKPSGRPHDYSYRAIKAMKAVAAQRPVSYKNELAPQTAPEDQYERGICCGESGAYLKHILYMMLTGSLPTSSDKTGYKRDVTDKLGTLTDILYRESPSAECVYQKSRELGHVTYPEGSETRFVGMALTKYGANIESQWHTAKTPTNVWETPIATADGGLSIDDATKFAALHKVDGWAIVGDTNGNTNWDEVCQAIWDKKVVLAGIPVYENYDTMQGGDGSFPDPKGSIVGYHALCFYGYDENKMYLLHSWGTYCGRYGSISKNYFNQALSESIYIVILDSSEVAIGKETTVTLTITAKEKGTNSELKADVYIDGVLIGKSPQKVAIERQKSYDIEVKMAGYTAVKKKYRVTAKKKTSLNLTLSLKKRKG